MSELKETIIAIVNEVPEGFVVSFVAVAREVMKRTKKTVTAQLVGRQLSGMPEHERVQLPWWRVVNKAGYVSSLKLWAKGLRQIALLEKEGNEIVHGYIQDPERWEFARI